MKRFLTSLPTLLAIFGIAASLPQALAGIPLPAPEAPPVQQGNPDAQVQQQALQAEVAEPTYSIGDPTDLEQYYVELINRARANPNAEALRLKNTTDTDVLGAYSYFSVNLNLMVSQFAALTVAPPLSINPKLTAAARIHSQDMLVNEYQDHLGIDGSMPWDRASAQGYNWSSFGENVYATATSVFEGHAGFEVDWGGSTGGMQSPAGHRLNIHNATFREIGVGVVLGTNGTVGPQLVTQDFAVPSAVTPFITGVAYYDFNSNGAYDPGEGIGGVTVTVTGANFNAVTSTSGGYSVPVPDNGSYTVTFSAPGVTTQQSTVTVAGGNNVKVDFTPAYVAPTITGPATLTTGVTGSYTYTSVGGATDYELKKSVLASYTLVEGAEKALSAATATVSGYSAVEADTVKNGSYAFHLAQPAATTQTLQLNHTLLVSASSVLTFWSRLGWASPSQIAAAQISTDGGNQWQDVWTAAGTNTAGQTAFALRSVSLSAFAGQDIMVRFVYRFSSGSYYPQTSAGVGFYIDDIAVSNALELMSSTTSSVADGAFQFSSLSATYYTLAVRAILPGRTLPWGPDKVVSVQSPQPTVTLTVTATPANAGTVTGGGSYPGGSSVPISATPNSGWMFSTWNDGNTQASRTVTVPTGGGTFTATFVQLPVAAQLTSPTAGTTLTSATAALKWGGGIGVTSYALKVGSTLNGTDIFNKTVTTTSQSVTGVPVDGRTIYVSLSSLIGGQYQTANYTFTAFSAQSQILTVNSTPMTTGQLTSNSATFAWSKGTGVTSNMLAIGSTVGGTDIFNKTFTGTSQTVPLSTDGRTLYVKLSSLVNKVWISKSYTFTAATIASYPATMAKVTTKSTVLTTGSGAFTSGTAAFTWNPGNQATSYSLAIGSTPGGTDVYNATQGTALTKSVKVPVDGRTLYVTLSSWIDGGWKTNSYTYTAFSAQAKITTVNGAPLGNVLPVGVVTFKWGGATGVTAVAGGAYTLTVGNAPGGKEYFNARTAGTSGTASKLPQDGRTLYITLSTYIGGQWLKSVYVCQAASTL